MKTDKEQAFKKSLSKIDEEIIEKIKKEYPNEIYRHIVQIIANRTIKLKNQQKQEQVEWLQSFLDKKLEQKEFEGYVEPFYDGYRKAIWDFKKQIDEAFEDIKGVENVKRKKLL